MENRNIVSNVFVATKKKLFGASSRRHTLFINMFSFGITGFEDLYIPEEIF